MCAVSMILDDWQKRYPNIPGYPGSIPADPFNPYGGVTRQEFDALKKELEALKDLLKAAKIYDEKTGQPDCEMEDKKKLLLELADKLGVDLKEIFNG